jgi:hypothetical protein
MTLRTEHSLPRWLIDDTSDVTNARIFCVHTQTPWLVGELLPDDEAELSGIELSGLPYGQVLSRIAWIDEPVFDADDLCRSLADAIRHHAAVRGWNGTQAKEV